MLYSLALAALTATPAQGGELKLTNVRMTVGELGPPRQSSKLLPGDVLFIGYEINGLAIEGDGTAKYKMSMEVIDGAGKAIFKQDPRELVDFVPLRGNTLPARAFITIGLDQDPGNYEQDDSSPIGVVVDNTSPRFTWSGPNRYVSSGGYDGDYYWTTNTNSGNQCTGRWTAPVEEWARKARQERTHEIPVPSVVPPQPFARSPPRANFV